MDLGITKQKINNIIEKAKNYIVGNSAETKLDILLNHVIDTIELRGDSVYIKTNKNIAIQNNGHFVHVNSGVHVTISSQIHLNPKIAYNKKHGLCNDINELEFDKLQEKLDESIRVEEEFQRK